VENEFGLEIGDEDWWKEAERRVLRDARRDQRRALARRITRWTPLLLVIPLVGAGGAWLVRDGRAPNLPGLADAADAGAEAGAVPLTTDALLDPFLGTPAERFSSGAASFAMPTPKPIGEHSAAEVAANLRTATNLLFLTRLDPRMVERRDPAAFLAVLSERERRRTAPDFAGAGEGTSGVASRLAPGSTLLAPPRYEGKVTVAAGPDGEVVVATDYVFVYALTPTRPVYDRADTHLVVRSRVEFSFTADPRWSAEDQGVGIGDVDIYYTNMDCAKVGRGLLALPPLSDLSGAEGDGGDTEEHYRSDRPMPTGGTCPEQSPRPVTSPTPPRTTYT